jgi:Holliday junction resolvase RusA-like endonuclease
VVAVRAVSDSNGTTWFCIGINPEPWAVGPLQVGRRGGKVFPTMGRHAGLAAYQEAIREELGDGFEPLDGKQRVRFYFWRNQPTYTTAGGRAVHKNFADVTNMQKALEDALQGILFVNDRDTWDIRSVIVDQGPDVIGKVLFSVEPLQPYGIPQECLALVKEVDDSLTTKVVEDNSWPPSR